MSLRDLQDLISGRASGNAESAGCNSEDSSSQSPVGSFLRSLLAGVPWSEGAHCDEVLELPVPRHGGLRVHNPNGRTEIVGEERDDIRVELHKSARAESSSAAQDLLAQVQVVAESAADHLELDVVIPKKWNRFGNADLRVRTPRDLEISITAANGKMCLRGLRNRITARSANGSVHIADVVGDIDVSTANAPVSCSCTCGRLTARSSNGKIELTEHSGSLDASTSNGLIRATLLKLGTDGIVLATSNGRIALDLPEHVDADVDIRVENGVIRNQRELESQADPTAGRLRGRLGRGGRLIKLRTSNGVISLR